MGLRSGSDSVAAVGSLCGVAVLEALLEGSGVAVLEALFEGGGGGSGHTADLVSSESRSTSLAPVHDARGPVGRPHGPI
jgi:hypothetical protein